MSLEQQLGLEATPFETRAAFDEYFLGGIQQAQREIWLADHDFSRWPLNQVNMENALVRFLQASRANRLRLLIHSIQPLQSQMPRFMRLFRNYGHAIECRNPPEHLANRFSEEYSLMIVDRIILLRRFQRNSMRGVYEQQPSTVGLWVDQYESLWEESSSGLTGTVLGLGA